MAHRHKDSIRQSPPNGALIERAIAYAVPEFNNPAASEECTSFCGGVWTATSRLILAL